MRHITIILVFISAILFSQENELNKLDPFIEFPKHTFQVDIGKYGIDTLQCEENLTIYNEFYKQKSYDSALNAWFYLFINSPKRTKNLYIHGATMYKSFIKNETDRKKYKFNI